MSAISDYFQGNSLMNYTQKRVQLHKTIKPSLSASEKKVLLKNISMVLNRDKNNPASQQINILIEKKKAEIEEKYGAAIVTSSGRAKTKFQPLDPLEQDLQIVEKAITRMIKSYNSWGGQQISKKFLKAEGENIGTIRDQLDSLKKQLSLVLQFPNQSNIENIISYYNYLIELIGSFTPVHALAQGDFFEAVIAIADQLKTQTAENLAIDTVLENIKKTIVGADIEVTPQKKGQQVKISKNEAEASLITSQGKVDVILTSSKKSKTKPINVSAKSYSSFKHIVLESKTSIEKMLIGEAVNYSKAILLGLAASEEAEIFNKAKESFELLASYKALTGDYYGRTKATLFVLNNVKTKKVYIVEMAEILKDAYNNDLKNKSVFSIEPQNYYSILRGLNNYNDLIAASSKAKLNVIFSTTGRILNRLEHTVSG